MTPEEKKKKIAEAKAFMAKLWSSKSAKKIMKKPFYA